MLHSCVLNWWWWLLMGDRIWARYMEQRYIELGNENVPKIVINNAIHYSFTAIGNLVISNHNSFRVVFEKNCFRVFYLKIYFFYFSIRNGQPGKPALCQLYRHSFDPSWCGRRWAASAGKRSRSVHPLLQDSLWCPQHRQTRVPRNIDDSPVQGDVDHRLICVLEANISLSPPKRLIGNRFTVFAGCTSLLE